MKNPKRVAELLAELLTLSETDFERHRIDVLERDLTAPPTVENIDDKHQSFNGFYFRQTRDGHFVSSNQPIHRAVWSYYNGEIPDGYHIHHIDGNKANNAVENLQCLTATEHSQLHNPPKRGTRLVKKMFVCQNCGREYEAFDAGVNRFCSADCRTQYEENQARTIAKICPYCGKEFKTRHANAECCSHSCASKLLHERKNKRITRICSICGNQFETTPSANRQTCSKSCAMKLRWQRAHAAKS